MIKFYIIIVRNDSEENAGAICRLMGNYDFNDLILISPAWQDIKKAKIIAHTNKGLEIFDKIKKYKTLNEVIKKLNLNLTIGFSRRAGRIREISGNHRTFFRDFFGNKKLSNAKIGLIFGSEESGLSDDEIKLCNNIVYIQTSNYSPSLNLSHAVGIVLNEIFLHQKSNARRLSNLVLDVENNFIPTTIEERELFYKEIIEISKRKKLFIKNDEETFKRMFERIFSSPIISKKDLKLLKRLLLRFLFADRTN